MNSRIVVTLAAVALALFANAQTTYQPMVSKPLLEKRIHEVNTNINTKLAKLRIDVHDMIEARYAVETNASEIAKKNADIMMRKYGYAIRGDDVWYANCTNRGETIISPTTDGKLLGLYMSWDRKNHNGYACATNAYANIASWQKRIITDGGATTNVDFFITTGDGERYNLSSGWRIKERTYTCTTNSSRIITVRYDLFDDVSHRILLGLE